MDRFECEMSLKVVEEAMQALEKYRDSMPVFVNDDIAAERERLCILLGRLEWTRRKLAKGA